MFLLSHLLNYNKKCLHKLSKIQIFICFIAHIKLSNSTQLSALSIWKGWKGNVICVVLFTCDDQRNLCSDIEDFFTKIKLCQRSFFCIFVKNIWVRSKTTHVQHGTGTYHTHLIRGCLLVFRPFRVQSVHFEGIQSTFLHFGYIFTKN